MESDSDATFYESDEIANDEVVEDDNQSEGSDWTLAGNNGTGNMSMIMTQDSSSNSYVSVPHSVSEGDEDISSRDSVQEYTESEQDQSDTVQGGFTGLEIEFAVEPASSSNENSSEPESEESNNVPEEEEEEDIVELNQGIFGQDLDRNLDSDQEQQIFEQDQLAFEPVHQQQQGFVREQHIFMPQEPQIFVQEPQIYAQEPQIFIQEPQIFEQEQQIFAQEPQIFAQEPQVFADEQQIYAQEQQVYLHEQHEQQENVISHNNSDVSSDFDENTSSVIDKFIYNEASDILNRAVTGGFSVNTEVSKVYKALKKGFMWNSGSQSPGKRKRTSNSSGDYSSGPSKRSKHSYSDDDEEDGQLCPICLDVWSNSGDHRVCSLKCGHLFGYSCVKRWINSQVGNMKACPTCKTRATKRDIRFIFVKKLVAADTSEIDKLKLKLDKACIEKNALEIELQGLKFQMKQEVGLLKGQIKSLMTEAENIKSTNNKVEVRMYKEKSIEINRDGGCRVLDYGSLSKTVAVSMASPNPLFAGFGVRKINMQMGRSTAFIPLHTKPVRDLKWHPQNDWLLSVSLDQKAKLVDMSNNSSIATFSCDFPLWSCCWDTNNPNNLFVGAQNGSVFKYDVREPTEPSEILQIPGDMFPVVSLACTSWCTQSVIRPGSVLCCKLNSFWAFANMSSGDRQTYSRIPFGLEGPFVSMSYNNQTQHMLVSSRPSQHHCNSRHVVCTIQKSINKVVDCNICHTFQGALSQKLLSRSCLVNLENDMFAAAHNETLRNVTIWSVNSGQAVHSIPAHQPVLDLCYIPGTVKYLASLNETKLDFYKIEI